MPSSQTGPAISVVMPAYQEAENLALLLPQLRSVLDSLGVSWEVLVVDTAQPRDETPEICARVGVTHVPREGGDSYGDAIRTGMARCRGERVVIMDSDGSHDPEFVRTLWEHRDDADIVIASRYVPGGDTQNPWALVAMSKALNLVFSAVVHLPAKDVSNSFRLYRGEQLRSIQVELDHFDVQEELFARLLWELPEPATVAEVPFAFKARLHGSSKRSMTVFIAAYLAAMVRLRKMRRGIRDARGR